MTCWTCMGMDMEVDSLSNMLQEVRTSPSISMLSKLQQRFRFDEQLRSGGGQYINKLQKSSSVAIEGSYQLTRFCSAAVAPPLASAFVSRGVCKWKDVGASPWVFVLPAQFARSCSTAVVVLSVRWGVVVRLANGRPGPFHFPFRSGRLLESLASPCYLWPQDSQPRSTGPR